MQLDSYDQRILYEVDRDSHIGLTQLSRKLSRSKPFVLNRMRRLEKEGIITGYHAIVDMAKLGYFSFRVYIKFRNMTEKDGKLFVEFLKKEYPQVWTITSMHGKWDYALFLGVKNIMEFHNIWDGMMLKYKGNIKQYNVAVYAPVYNFNRTFFVETNEEVVMRIYGDGSAEDVDDLDWEIIQEYAPAVRKSSMEISKAVGVSADTVRARIKKLEERKIICGYKIGLNQGKLGYEGYRVDLELSSTKDNKRLFEFCRQHKNIYQINKSIGGANFEMEVIVKDLQHLLKLIDEIKMEFKEAVDDVDYFGFSTFHILNYIPD
ncbi:Lrp/AsnC family transcriptional regulator [Candidatus Woesearchaeota archaeon]|jgi:Lrp/AsnC family transcriptional regulator, leucine-responsive regulatory protein|nr:Lrp/AsnC family transcriptional regulator [Candidatus Woesearchaeota archaeon]MBT3537547.1 Lrp/AsnC family transcriptional regulator [Candidatus Woesearchaeota archaeon]MBT4696851.1 Lrp/AsnC family transcriptional regulator [Candidatus Woesearchaeota archaeon]MBT7106143.1 Lrp/AsnC family transcriptional regulator [Candidatus Woesearchaeota archaeon]MBT7930959.1 Lrp/AsnC family transcriptional regulator [Candidatus Woesearchaeota archaeon]